MSASENSLVKQLKAVIEEDKRVIRVLQEEVDRLRFLLGLHSLKATDSASGHPPDRRTDRPFSNPPN